MNPKYPIYIISKGRWESRLTARSLDKINVPYHIVVEPQEYDLYCKSLGKHRVLKLPFANLGLGSYPARNFCWEHAKALGYKYHFLFDDNIQNFAKWINGKRKKWTEIKTALLYVEQNANKTNVDILGFEEFIAY